MKNLDISCTFFFAIYLFLHFYVHTEIYRLQLYFTLLPHNLKRWRFALARRGMKVSRSKIEYMCVNKMETSGIVRLQGAEVVKVQTFKY